MAIKKPLFARIAQPTFGSFLLKRNKVAAEDMQILSTIQPPFLVISNHVHTMDPFFIGAASPVHIRWVAGAYLFKLFSLRYLLRRWVGAISKQQGRSDLFTVREIEKALKHGDVVGLFPEGTRTWDGEPVGFNQSTAKLIRLLRVPIVVIHLEGFYGLKPRWAKTRRLAETKIKVASIIMPEELKHMSLQQLHEHLLSALGYSYREWQQQHKRPYPSDMKAEGLEKVLYLCPDCKKPGTIHAKGKNISCSHCSYTVELDPYDRLKLIKGTTELADIAAWHAWERSYISGETGRNIEYPSEQGVLLQTGDIKKLTTLTKHFTLQLKQDGMEINHVDGAKQFFAFQDIESMIINAKNTLELYHKGTIYRIRIIEQGSTLKYVELYQAYQKLHESEGDSQ